MADALLEPGFLSAHPEFEAHMAQCAECGQEWADLLATMAMMNEWTAPEPTPYFDTRLHARLREAVEAKPESFMERVRSWMMFSAGRSFRPMAAGALAVVMVLCGGGVALELYSNQAQPSSSATVNDLKIIDNNATALQQMDQLLSNQDDNSTDAPST
ncbi:anti-sigma factor family protein [Granulicella cerasi]|uniref:Anti-sigma factor family protein n=1 Tax=Granulicella cerasi TaxID=741063 RepID=A0ABW1ZF03_9BACT|nr:hypothetical protein [Granulicella cerasi]